MRFDINKRLQDHDTFSSNEEAKIFLNSDLRNEAPNNIQKFKNKCTQTCEGKKTVTQSNTDSLTKIILKVNMKILITTR